MVGAEEAADPELPGEIKDECAKYGAVEAVKVHLVGGGGEQQEVSVFVLFAEPAAAEAARAALNGRFFGGRTVRSALYDHGRFLAGDFC